MWCKSGIFNLIFAVFVFITQSLHAQQFERIETVSGLGILEENNGVAVADYDSDFDLDIFVVAKAMDEEGIEKSHSRLFRNNNDGSFSDVTDESGLMNLFPFDDDAEEYFGLVGFKHGASWGDYNNDG
ncbi:MAG: VCBS repeat-containing protein, partial [Flavobacteriaceae bacterium]|nr:VCBS repeat-containing protein [Flavobacteriaceae bacterium]